MGSVSDRELEVVEAWTGRKRVRLVDPVRSIDLDRILCFVDLFAHDFLAQHALVHAMVLLDHLHEVRIVRLVAIFAAFGPSDPLVVLAEHHRQLHRWVRHDCGRPYLQLVFVVFFRFDICNAQA